MPTTTKKPPRPKPAAKPKKKAAAPSPWMDPAWLEGAAECLRVLGHPARLRMIELLTRERCNVKQIAEHCSIPQNQACEHLRLMKHHGLLDAEKEGRTVFYRVVGPQALSLLQCMKSNCPNWVSP